MLARGASTLSAKLRCSHRGASLLPVAVDALPVRTHLLPSVGNPMTSVVLEYEASGNPRIRMTAPFPVTRSPDVAVARGRGPLVACRRGCHIGFGAHAGKGHGRSSHSADAQTQRNQQSSANSLHFSNSRMDALDYTDLCK